MPLSPQSFNLALGANQTITPSDFKPANWETHVAQSTATISVDNANGELTVQAEAGSGNGAFRTEGVLTGDGKIVAQLDRQGLTAAELGFRFWVKRDTDAFILNVNETDYSVREPFGSIVHTFPRVPQQGDIVSIERVGTDLIFTVPGETPFTTAGGWLGAGTLQGYISFDFNAGAHDEYTFSAPALASGDWSSSALTPTWTVSGAATAAGISVDGSGIVSADSEAIAGTYYGAVIASASGRREKAHVTIIAGAPEITTESLTDAIQGTGYSSGALGAVGGTPPYAWDISDGELPDGLSINASTGAIEGTPTEAGEFTFTVRVTDDAESTDEQELTLTVNAPGSVPSITTTSLPDGTVDVAYSQTVTATGGATPYAWDISTGALPGGLSLNAGSGAITGTPTTAGTFNFTVQVTDDDDEVDTQALTIIINPEPPPPGDFTLQFEVGDTALPLTQGFPIKKSEAILTTANLCIKDADDVPIPAAFRVLSRWEGLPTDVTKPIKWLLCDFLPTGPGTYTLDDSADTVTDPPALTVDNSTAITVTTEAGLEVVIPKTGSHLLNSLKLATVEQLDTENLPTLTIPLPGRARAVQHETAIGAYAANAGTSEVRVSQPGAFQVGQQIRFEWKANFLYTTNGIPKAINYDGNYGYAGSKSALGNRRFIFARGTADEFILTNYQFLWDIDPRHIARTEPVPIDGLPGDMPENSTLEDYEAFLEPVKTIVSIDDDVLTLDDALTYPVLVNCEILPVTAGPDLIANLKVLSATVEEQNDLRTVVKQTCELEQDSANPYPFVSIAVRWYAYANESFVRCRVRLRNHTDDYTDTVGDAAWRELKLQFKLANAATESDDEITAHSGAGSACARIIAGESSSVAVAGSLRLAVAEFAENFPQRLQATGSEFNYWLFPPKDDLTDHSFWKHRAKTWDFYLGSVGAVAAVDLTGKTFVTPPIAYACESKAIRHSLTPRKTWLASDFQGNARKAEAANRAERLIACGYSIEDCDAQVDLLPGQQRMSLFEWRLSNHLYTGNNNKGEHFGWDKFGNTRDGDGEGYTFNRYDVNFVLLREWFRTGDARAYRLGNEHSRYMMDFGTVQSSIAFQGNTDYILQGLSFYEHGSLLVGTVQPQPTHSWDEGIYLYWAVTGDPIARETLTLRRESARRWNFGGIGQGTGIDSAMSYNQARGPGWAALTCLNAYRYLGDPSDLAKCKQYLDNLKDSEISQGNKGVWVASGYEPSSSTGTQPFLWAGYPDVALTEYIREKQFQGAADAAMENFVVRQAKWLARGDATLTQPGNNKPLVGGVLNGANYTPVGSIYAWFPTGNTTAEVGTNALADLCALTLIAGARLGQRADLRQLADRLFEDVCFYRDAPDGARAYTQRTQINLRNAQFFESSIKVWGQTAQALADYLPDAAANNELNPPALTDVTPDSIASGQEWILTLTGTGFVAGAQVAFGGDVVTPDDLSATEITITIPVGLVTGSSQPIAVINPNGGQSESLNVTITGALAPTVSGIAPSSVAAGSGDFELVVTGQNFQDGAIVRLDGVSYTTRFDSATQLTADIPGSAIAVSGTKAVTVRNPDTQTSGTVNLTITNATPAISSLAPNSAAAGTNGVTMFVVGTGFVSNSVVRWNGNAITTAYSNALTLIAQVPANLLLTAGTASVTVFNPTPGGGVSNALTFTITSGGGPGPGPGPEPGDPIPLSSTLRPAKRRLRIQQGSTFRETLKLTSDGDRYIVDPEAPGTIHDLTGATARLQVRTGPARLVNNILLDLSTADDDEITIDAEAGTIALHVDESLTAELEFRRAFYDLVLTVGDDVITVLSGDVLVRPRITVVP